MFSIMAGEARDGHTEQLAICVRYVTEGRVKECLLAMRELRAFDAESITADVKCVAQAYDGASVMSGAIGGVQAKFRDKHPEAFYVHCYVHKLNLVLCHTCHAVPEASDLFDT